ncbi:hypothetical protein [Sphaerimonospora mesophila]|uniref:hypothetical protein n=1 Tax=Sphaerimonospora mesophila TaxID=37483 RepID=UPI000AD72DAB
MAVLVGVVARFIGGGCRGRGLKAREIGRETVRNLAETRDYRSDLTACTVPCEPAVKEEIATVSPPLAGDRRNQDHPLIVMLI